LFERSENPRSSWFSFRLPTSVAFEGMSFILPHA
jgi:hypothetical protein